MLFADTFNTYFEPENLRAAVAVLRAGGYTVHAAVAGDGRPLCCGRTYLATGMIDAARTETRRVLDALGPFIDRGVAIVGVEPSCILGLRDEVKLLHPGSASSALARAALTFEEFVVREACCEALGGDLSAGRPMRAHSSTAIAIRKPSASCPRSCTALKLVPELAVEVVPSSCCGMAGAFGYRREYLDVSLRMAEADLLPAVRNAGADTVIVADGTSCRHQIHDGAQREAQHVARVLAAAL